MIDLGPVEDWEIWAGNGLALVIAAADPDKPWLTRLMKRKYRMEGVVQGRAMAVFKRALAGGYLIQRLTPPLSP